MFMIMAATAMLLVFMFVFSKMYQDNLTEKQRILIEDYSYSLQNEFIIASQTKPGFIRTFLVPETLEGYSYNATIANNFLFLSYPNNIFSLPIPKVNGTIIKGLNTISNNGGNLCLNC